MQKKLALKINTYFFYGWTILIVSALGYFFSSPGQTYSISIFIDAYIKEFDFSRTSMSSLYSIATILSGITMIVVGKSVDIFGPRKMLVLSGLGLALITFFNSFITNIFMIFISFYFLRVFGQGALTLIPSSLVPQWFDKRRALALSLLSMGAIIGNLIVPKINYLIIDALGWKMAWTLWGIFILAFFVPIVWLFTINKPEDIYLLPDNAPAQNHETINKNMALLTKTSFTLKEAIRTKDFWLIGLMSMIVPMVSTGLMFHFYSIMATKGIDEAATSTIIGLIALPGFLLPVISGTIIDKYLPKHTLSVAFSIVACSLFYMKWVNSITGAIIFILVYGLANNIIMVTCSVIWPKYFGRLYLGSIRGASTVFIVIGSALGAIPFGLSYDIMGNYDITFIIMAIIAMLSVLISSLISPPQKQ